MISSGGSMSRIPPVNNEDTLWRYRTEWEYDCVAYHDERIANIAHTSLYAAIQYSLYWSRVTGSHKPPKNKHIALSLPRSKSLSTLS